MNNISILYNERTNTHTVYDTLPYDTQKNVDPDGSVTLASSYVLTVTVTNLRQTGRQNKTKQNKTKQNKTGKIGRKHYYRYRTSSNSSNSSRRSS